MLRPSSSPAPRAAAALAALIVGVATSTAAAAQPAVGPPPAEGRAPAAACVELASGRLPEGIDREALRRRLIVELGSRVVDAPATDCTPRGVLAVDEVDGHAARVRFTSPDGIATEQTAELPDDDARALETIALFAGNVARDEAAEIRARMRRRAAPPPRPVRLVPAEPSGCELGDRPRHPVGGDFVPYVGSSIASPEASRVFSLNAIGGVAGSIEALEIGGVFDVVTGCVAGVEIAGVVSAVGGAVRGVQIGGVVSGTAGRVRGAQIAGVAGRAAAVDGLQIGGVTALAGEVTGAQIATVSVAGRLDGAQIDVVSVAGEGRGLQIGVVNVAGPLRGAQIGVFNVADASDFSLGVVSIVKNGETRLDAWGSSSGFVMAGVEHGTKHFRNLYGVGLRLGGDTTRVAGALGLGGRVPLGPAFGLDLDALVYDVHTIGTPWHRDVLLSELRAALALELIRGVAPFAGVSYGVAVAQRAEDASLGSFGQTRFTDAPKNAQVFGFPGLFVGVHLL